MDRFGINTKQDTAIWADAETDKQDAQDGVTKDYSGGFNATK